MKLSDSVTGLQHIGIPSADLQKSMDFYDALGFTKIYETVNGEEHVAFMELGGLVLELYGNRSIKGESGAIDHIALNSTDIEASYAACKELGLTFFEDLSSLPFWDNGIRYFSVVGPSKEIVEICQKL